MATSTDEVAAEETSFCAWEFSREELKKMNNCHAYRILH